MKVLLVADEYFSWGVHGGFGAFTRKLGKELVKKGIEVDAIVHKISPSQKPVGDAELIDGVLVKTLPRRKPSKLISPELYLTDADIIHSQCGMYDTYLTFKRNPSLKKIVTIQDLRTKKEYDELENLEMFSKYPWYKAIWANYVKNCYRKAMKMSDVIACQAHVLFPKVREVFGVDAEILLPNFIDIPTKKITKSKNPSIIWLARLDPIKQPEICFGLAEKTPDVDFYILGSSHEKYGGKSRDDHFREKYSHVKNLHFLGFQTGEVKERILSEAWILINTSAYECLPVSFLEGMAHKCAILSNQNPDHYTTHYGAWVSRYTDFEMKLDQLLKDDHWKEQGERGYNFVKNTHSTEIGVEKHIALYRDELKEG
jgi:glycosyltransferase involved in cell wall biosynthesis